MNNKKQPDGLVSESRRLLQNPYAHLNAVGQFDGASSALLGNPYASLSASQFDPDAGGGLNFFRGTSERAIESSARELLIQIWKDRKSIWPNKEVTPRQAIDPSAAGIVLGVNLEESPPLGISGEGPDRYEIAGYFNRQQRLIRISNRLPRSSWRFTATHEIGHWVLHREAIVLHRDRPIEGLSDEGRAVDPVERQANLFAARFLMPTRLVTESFTARFGDRIPFVLDSNSAFALAPGAQAQLLKSPPSPLELARRLASTEYFGGHRFISLADEFSTSVASMMYRLLEIGLIKKR